MSDSIHDMGDSLSIGISYFLEKKSKQKPDEQYTYGYGRYSVLGSFITTMILFIGSIFVIWNAFKRIVSPVSINYSGMIIFAIIGVFVNFLAAYFTREGESLNQKAVNLHMIEDVLGWLVVLIGAIIMKLTNISIIDPILSICVSIFIFINSCKNLKNILDLFLEKTPNNIDVLEIEDELIMIYEVEGIHHLHIWSLDGQNHFATMHIKTKYDSKKVKEKIKRKMLEFGIGHVTIEIEAFDEDCQSIDCTISQIQPVCCCGHKH